MNKVKYRSCDKYFVVCYYSVREPKIYEELEKALKEVEDKEYPLLRGYQTLREASKFKEKYWGDWKKGDVICYCLLPDELERILAKYKISPSK
ncbi:hypothetical protein [Brassicibacter mesophilus]|uniref:hypothetical protein n=1 Tax=Brassicibacter mesophilus TaxID=745119 RepID=UPI003D23A641